MSSQLFPEEGRSVSVCGWGSLLECLDGGVLVHVGVLQAGDELLGELLLVDEQHEAGEGDAGLLKFVDAHLVAGVQDLLI